MADEKKAASSASLSASPATKVVHCDAIRCLAFGSVLMMLSCAIRTTRLELSCYTYDGACGIIGSDLSMDNATSQMKVHPSLSPVESFEDLQLVRFLGSGDVSAAFEAHLHGRPVVAKFGQPWDIGYFDVELDIFDRLNAPPTIDNIPKLQMAFRIVRNPFNDTHYLKKELRTTERDVRERLVESRSVSVLVMRLLGEKMKPQTLDEMRTYLSVSSR